MDQSSRDLIERYFEIVWIERQSDQVYEFVAPDFVNHGSFPGYPTSTIEDARRIEDIVRQASDAATHRPGVRPWRRRALKLMPPPAAAEPVPIS